ncbi:TLN2 [Bugula neritina]|uniref:TLN2 n=1 Tax=Bugula neritina TaxID=10212 RepID=A0A7J7JQ15_BUGNE|nr:TLN2 [Bugula neritina]
MATLSLKICIDTSQQVKTMQFEPGMMVFDACNFIRHKVQEANRGNPQEYGLFLADEDPKKGVWLDNARSLEYYLLRNGDILQYKSKMRILRVRMLDDAVKTLQVDDSHMVSQLMVVICSRIGITNHDEYSLIFELPEEKENMSTLKKQSTIARMERKKLEEMKKKLHTDDELSYSLSRHELVGSREDVAGAVCHRRRYSAVET